MSIASATVDKLVLKTLGTRMLKVRLISWDETARTTHAAVLKAAKIQTDASPFQHGKLITKLRDSLAVLIDLDRKPSHGHAIAVLMRSSKSARHVPIVFAGGVKEKVDRIRREFPDAFYTEWPDAVSALKRALNSPPALTVRPMSHMERYAGTPLMKKLGFKPNTKTALLNAPEGFEEQLGELPDGAGLVTTMTVQTKMALWFVRSRQELEAEMDYLSARLPQGSSLWIIYPKQSSRFKVDFTQFDVRAIGLAAGWVDYKICAVDSDWTGLKFARKKN
jgi:hypothetical protein